MQLANPIHRRESFSRKRCATPSAAPASPEAIAEINAYIAIRDELFSEAEAARTRAKLDNATAANEFVMTCLRPARSPYQAQSLPENVATRERQRCEFVTGRIAQLRMLITPASRPVAS